MVKGDYHLFYEKLAEFIDSSRIIQDETRLLALSTDASFYRLIPKLIVRVDNLSELSKTISIAYQLKIPITFRAAGTSLSGQSISDSVLIIISNKFNKYNISADQSEISLEPALIGSHVNRVLLQFQKKIGPDPASINSAMIGGIVANNASGMCCGTSQNSYKTLSGMKIIFADGYILDTLNEVSKRDFLINKSELVSGVLSIHKRINQNNALKDKIIRKFKMKNTTGYSLNSFTDFDDPIDIIQHLLIGSEGTLGCIAEVTLKTVEELEYKASSLLIFKSIEDACKAIVILKQSPVEAVELMDRAALRSVQDKQGMPDYLKNLDDNNAALLVETRSKHASGLDEQIELLKKRLNDLDTVYPVEFTDDYLEYSKLWNIRKGLFPSVGAMRKNGTTCIIEDVAFPISNLAEATLDLQNLFQKYDYSDAIIFGHALEGNLHFVFNQDFNEEKEVFRYKDFMSEVTELVVQKYDGSLKAEHGTGRNMAPFVELEWGAEAYQLMKEVKQLFDPFGILNPGVILNDDNEAHLKNLKPLHKTNDIVDKCIECGFCEVNCVSNNLTLSPRQRITVLREISRLKDNKTQLHRLNEFLNYSDYLINQTCATDGLCATACPVGIDTGKMVKYIRNENNSKLSRGIAKFIAERMSSVLSLARLGLETVHYSHKLLGSDLLNYISVALNKLTYGVIPIWNRYFPRGTQKLEYKTKITSNRKVVYFPSCINRGMGVSTSESNEINLVTKTISLFEKAGYQVLFPQNIDNLCCGMAFASKGFTETGDRKSKELELELMKISNNGEIPIVCDMSPCLHRMKETLDKKLTLFEPVEFAAKYLVPLLEFNSKISKVAYFKTCSTKKLEIDKEIEKLLNLCTSQIINIDTACCGFAGDRGFTYPELNQHGLKDIKMQIPEDCKLGYSNSRTCEIGLSYHSEINFKSVIYLIDECTTAKSN